MREYETLVMMTMKMIRDAILVRSRVIALRRNIYLKCIGTYMEKGVWYIREDARLCCAALR